MSNPKGLSTEPVRSVRWRMRLPTEVVNAITSIATDEDRDAGAVAARWIKSFYSSALPTKKENADG